MTEILFTWILNLNLINSNNITAILIQRILAFQAKMLLFMTFWTNIGPHHIFIIIYVTIKNDRRWELSLFSCYLNVIIFTLL